MIVPFHSAGLPAKQGYYIDSYYRFPGNYDYSLKRMLLSFIDSCKNQLSPQNNKKTHRQTDIKVFSNAKTILVLIFKII